jgi:hypothetical protein
MIAKPTSIKGTGGKSDGCAWKADELIAGDLLHVSDSGLRVKRFILTLQRKSAAGVVCAEQRVVQEG